MLTRLGSLRLSVAIIFGCTVAFPQTPRASDVDDALSAFDKKDFSGATENFLKAAQAGDAKIQAALGVMYYEGIGIKRDHAKAMPWLLKAAEQGRPEAQYRLGLAYSRGSLAIEGDPPEDQPRAEMWFHKAGISAQGLLGTHDPAAEVTMGHLLTYGVGDVGTNKAKASEFFQDAALQGNVDAEFQLATVYDREKNIQKSFEWSAKAALDGHSGGMADLGLDYLNRHDNEHAVIWLRRSALLGNPIGSRWLLWRFNERIGKTELDDDNKRDVQRELPKDHRTTTATASENINPAWVALAVMGMLALAGRDIGRSLPIDDGPGVEYDPERDWRAHIDDQNARAWRCNFSGNIPELRC